MLERKTMVEHSLVLMERIRKSKVVCPPSSPMVSSVHLDLMDLKAKKKLTRINSTNLHPHHDHCLQTELKKAVALHVLSQNLSCTKPLGEVW